MPCKLPVCTEQAPAQSPKRQRCRCLVGPVGRGRLLVRSLVLCTAGNAHLEQPTCTPHMHPHIRPQHLEVLQELGQAVLLGDGQLEQGRAGDECRCACQRSLARAADAHKQRRAALHAQNSRQPHHVIYGVCAGARHARASSGRWGLSLGSSRRACGPVQAAGQLPTLPAGSMSAGRDQTHPVYSLAHRAQTIVPA